MKNSYFLSDDSDLSGSMPPGSTKMGNLYLDREKFNEWNTNKPSKNPGIRLFYLNFKAQLDIYVI